MSENIKIFENEPANWQQLEHLVAQILRGSGFKTEITKTITTVRGKVEVDVYAEKEQGVESIIICECKYWKEKIPQTVIHSFRTVVNDYGANQGYIIAKKGFQKGVYSAIEKSNTSILNWGEFQEKFKRDWLLQVIDTNYKIGQEILNLGIMISTRLLDKFKDDTERNSFYEQKESDFVFLTFREHYIDLDTHEFSITEVNQRINSYKKKLPIEIKCYNDFFNLIYDECKKILIKFHLIIESRNDLIHE